MTKSLIIFIYLCIILIIKNSPLCSSLYFQKLSFYFLFHLLTIFLYSLIKILNLQNIFIFFIKNLFVLYVNFYIIKKINSLSQKNLPKLSSFWVQKYFLYLNNSNDFVLQNGFCSLLWNIRIWRFGIFWLFRNRRS